MINTFSDFLRDAQQRLNLNESDMARLCKVSIPTVQRWKANKTRPHPLMVQAVRNILA